MADVTVKKEKVDDDVDLCDLLEDVKREEADSPDERAAANDEEPSDCESLIDELYREEVEGNSSDSALDEDINKLQELLDKRKKELEAAEQAVTEKVQKKSSNSSQKRKTHDNESTDGANGQNRKKSKRPSSKNRSRSKSPNQPEKNLMQQEPDNPTASTSNDQQQSSSGNEVAPKMEDATAMDKEIESLLKADDYNSGDEVPTPDQEVVPSSVAQPEYTLPTGDSMRAPMFDPTSQVMGGMQPGGYPFAYNMGLQPAFFAPNMANMPMMGYGFPQMPHIPVEQNEVECLPVVNSAGFSGMPTFKRIKLERIPEPSNEEVDPEEESAEERRKKVFETCTDLLEKLKLAELSGKFIYTSSVAKLNTSLVPNSIVQKITNVSYDFHSIGPKVNLADWGLRDIGNCNADIAKKIAISADVYFAKITEKANTIARQLIKREDTKTDDHQIEMGMEVEEPSLSSFLKNSMTQTDALVCQECVARKRIVGHNIGVQATVYTGSIGSQTSPVADDSVRLAAGLSVNQLKALYEFSSLIREPPKNTSIEMLRLRDNLINIYNLSQRGNIGPIPSTPPLVDFSPPSQHVQYHTPVLDPRTDNHANFDRRRFSDSEMSMPFSPSAMQAPRHMTPANNFPHYPQHTMHGSRNQSTSALIPVYPQPPSQSFRYPPVPPPDVRKGYGRGRPRQ